MDPATSRRMTAILISQKNRRKSADKLACNPSFFNRWYRRNRRTNLNGLLFLICGKTGLQSFFFLIGGIGVIGGQILTACFSQSADALFFYFLKILVLFPELNNWNRKKPRTTGRQNRENKGERPCLKDFSI